MPGLLVAGGTGAAGTPVAGGVGGAPDGFTELVVPFPGVSFELVPVLG